MKIQKNQLMSSLSMNPLSQGQSVKSGLFSNMLGKVDSEVTPPPVDGASGKNSEPDADAQSDDKIEATDADQKDKKSEDSSQSDSEGDAESTFTLSAEQIKAINPDTFSIEDAAAIQALAAQSGETVQTASTDVNNTQSTKGQLSTTTSGEGASSGTGQSATQLNSLNGVSSDETATEANHAKGQSTGNQPAAQNQKPADSVTLNPNAVTDDDAIKQPVSSTGVGYPRNDKTQNNTMTTSAADANANADSMTNSAAFESFADGEQAESRQYDQQKASTNVDLKQNGTTSTTQTNTFNVSQASTPVQSSAPEIEVKVTPDVAVQVNAGTSAAPETAVKIEQATPQQAISDSDTQQIVDRTMRGLKSVINQKGGSVTIRLTPVELGAMRIRVNMDGGTINAQLEVANRNTRQILQQQLTTLKQTLESQGFVIEQLNINHTPSLDDQTQTNTQKEQDHQSRSQDSREEQSAESEQREGQSETRSNRTDFEQELLDLIV